MGWGKEGEREGMRLGEEKWEREEGTGTIMGEIDRGKVSAGGRHGKQGNGKGDCEGDSVIE